MPPYTYIYAAGQERKAEAHTVDAPSYSHACLYVEAHTVHAPSHSHAPNAVQLIRVAAFFGCGTGAQNLHLQSVRLLTSTASLLGYRTLALLYIHTCMPLYTYMHAVFSHIYSISSGLPYAGTPLYTYMHASIYIHACSLLTHLQHLFWATVRWHSSIYIHACLYIHTCMQSSHTSTAPLLGYRTLALLGIPPLN